MDKDLHEVLPATTTQLKSILHSILSDEDAEKLSTSVIVSVHDNATECITSGAKNERDYEGNLRTYSDYASFVFLFHQNLHLENDITFLSKEHFGRINLPFTILNNYYMLEIAQVLSKI
ncbi:DNA-directed RNA polymerase, partial [Striga asiatica]